MEKKFWFVRVTFLLVIILGISAVCNDTFAQRNKKNKKKQESAVEVDRRQSEYYLSEGEKYFILEDYSKAFVLYQKALEYDANNATAYYKIASIFYQTDELDKALEYSNKALSINPENKYFYLLTAEIYTAQSNYQEAANTYTRLLERIPNSKEHLFDLAAIYIYQEDYDKALQTYDKIEEVFGLNEQVVNQKQRLYLRQGDLDKAIAEGDKLLAAYPCQIAFYIMQAEILQSNLKAERAIAYLKDAIECDPENAKVKLFLSDIYRKDGQIELANKLLSEAFENPDIEVSKKLQVMVGYMEKLPNKDYEDLCKRLGAGVLKSNPESADAWAVNGDLYSKLGDDDRALEFYREAKNRGASNYFIWQNILRIESIKGQYDSILVHADEALVYFPNQPIFYYFLGSAHYMQSDWEKATQTLSEGKKIAGGNKDLLIILNAQLGDAYNNLENYEKSDECYEEVLRIDPANDHVLNNYSYFLSLRKENLEKAEKMSTKLVKKHPNNPTYLDTHAWVLYNKGDFKEALRFIEIAVNSDEASGTIIEHYGDILYQLGEVDEAVKQWQKAKGLDETSELIDKKIADRKLYE